MFYISHLLHSVYLLYVHLYKLQQYDVKLNKLF